MEHVAFLELMAGAFEDMRADPAGFGEKECHHVLQLITEPDAASLIDALDFIEKLRIEHQNRQLHAGKRPDNHLAPDELSSLVRHNLKSAFNQVSVSQSALLNRFHLA